ncbi:MAG: hypothetical protein LCH69_06805 [Proteobacteria bacterium]|nr:hypothetical protein [Pseudomonadota bacterium]
MSEDEAKGRSERHFKILFRIGGPLLTVFRPDEPLCLGFDFALRTGRMFDEFEQKRKAIIGELREYTWGDLKSSFTEGGAPILDAAKAWLSKHRSEFLGKYERVSEWYLAPFTASDLADYDYWSKSAFLTLDEALFLSVGLQPQHKFIDRLGHRADNRDGGQQVVEFLTAKRELFRRELDPSEYDRRHKPKTILDWVNRVDLEVHPGFRRMLEKMIGRFEGRLNPSEPSAPQEEAGSRVDAREKVSMAKIIAAMAIREYGYNPSSKRSPIPREIEGIAAELGIDITHDTIRTYLQMGARYLPKDWKPNG